MLLYHTYYVSAPSDERPDRAFQKPDRLGTCCPSPYAAPSPVCPRRLLLQKSRQRAIAGTESIPPRNTDPQRRHQHVASRIVRNARQTGTCQDGEPERGQNGHL